MLKYIKQYLDMLDKNRRNFALMLMSDPGLGKTTSIYSWAEEHDRDVVTKIISQCMPTEVVGMAMPDSDSKRMRIFDFDELLDMKDGDILFFDELTNGNAQTLNACLTLIQERVLISGKKLPDILIVAAGNPQGACDMLPQVKQRFLWVDVSFDADAWCEYMKAKYGIKPSMHVVTDLEYTYKHQFRLDTNNYTTARSVDNLYHMALTVPRSHPIWEGVQDYPSSLIDRIYADIDRNSAWLQAKRNASDCLAKEAALTADISIVEALAELDNHVESKADLVNWLKEVSPKIQQILMKDASYDPEAY